jgi:transaldolase
LAGAVVLDPAGLAQWCAGAASMSSVIARVCESLESPLMVPVRGRTREELLQESERLIALSPRVRVALPGTVEGLVAAERLTSREVPVLITPCGTLGGVAAAAAAFVNWVAPDLSRASAVGIDVARLVRNSADLLTRVTSETKLVPTGINSADEANAALAAGAHGVIVAHAIWKQLTEDRVCTQAMIESEHDWERIARP